MARTSITTSISRPQEGELADPYGLTWKVSFTKTYDGHSSSTNVEYLTQGELLTLWQQIGALFNLAGMRKGLSDADLEKMGVHLKK